MAPPTKVFPEDMKKYHLDNNHQVNEKSPIRQITQYECDLSQPRKVVCYPIDRFFRIAKSGGIVEIEADEVV